MNDFREALNRLNYEASENNLLIFQRGTVFVNNGDCEAANLILGLETVFRFPKCGTMYC